jgi:hypothetical protein
MPLGRSSLWRAIRIEGRLTHSFPLAQPPGLPVYVAQRPLAPFLWDAAAFDTNALQRPIQHFNASIDPSRVFLSRRRVLTIRNLTRRTSALTKRSVMTTITVKRTVTRQTRAQRSAMRKRRSFRELTRSYLVREKTLEFAMEALLFAIIVAISAWPVLAAANAVGTFL